MEPASPKYRRGRGEAARSRPRGQPCRLEHATGRCHRATRRGTAGRKAGPRPRPPSSPGATSSRGSRACVDGMGRTPRSASFAPTLRGAESRQTVATPPKNLPCRTDRLIGGLPVSEKAFRRGSKRRGFRSNRGESVGFEPGCFGRFRSLVPLQKTTVTPSPADQFVSVIVRENTSLRELGKYDLTKAPNGEPFSRTWHECAAASPASMFGPRRHRLSDERACAALNLPRSAAFEFWTTLFG